MKTYPLLAYEENTLFVWGSFNEKTFKGMPDVTEDMTIVVQNASNPFVIIYNTSGLTKQEKDDVVKQHCSMMANGCNFRPERQLRLFY